MKMTATNCEKTNSPQDSKWRGNLKKRNVQLKRKICRDWDSWLKASKEKETKWDNEDYDNDTTQEQ